MKADPSTEAAVLQVLAQVVERASDGDVDGAVALFADDPDVFLLGSGVDEARTGHGAIRAQIMRDLNQADAVLWRLSSQSVSAAGPVAWTSGDVVVRVIMGGQSMDLPHRLTTVLECRDGSWRLQQMHLSFANGAQALGQSYPTNLEAVADAVGREAVDLRARLAPNGTITLLFTDLQESTQMAEALGDIRWLALLREHNAIVSEQIARHGGFEVKTIGDAFMVAFGSARRAVQCAIGIQQGIAQYGADHPEQAMRVRIGLHAGEPVREGHDFHGRSVIFASRIAEEAAGGEILASSLLRELTDSAGDIHFEAGRDLVLKGLTGTHRVFPVRQP